MSAKNKKISFVLYLEQDYGRIDGYLGFKNIDKLIALFKKYNLKLTIFTIGKIIEHKNEILKKFKDNVDCEFQLHSYSHEINRGLTAEERKIDLKKAVESYKKYFGKNPTGYSAPCGDITKDEIEWLKKEGFLYSSSFIPTYRPGLFNNLGQKDKAFVYPNGLLEIPFSSLPLVRMPFSLSYFQLLGWSVINLLIKIKKTPYIVFNFHLHNLSKLDNIKQLKTMFRLGYIRNQNNGFKILEKFIKTIIKNNYQPIIMTELAEEILNDKIE
jgi:peptidoglycan/xylan/chitin deacetylase (PgdA/CDA1 family)